MNRIALELTLTGAATNYNLATLIAAALAAAAQEPFRSGFCVELRVEALSTNAAPVKVGGLSMTATNFGQELAAGAALPPETASTCGTTIDLGLVYVRSESAGQKIRVTARCR